MLPQDDEPEREKDLQGNVFKTVAELQAEQAAKRGTETSPEAQQAARVGSAVSGPARSVLPCIIVLLSTLQHSWA
jgi:hypothetical protein